VEDRSLTINQKESHDDPALGSSALQLTDAVAQEKPVKGTDEAKKFTPGGEVAQVDKIKTADDKVAELPGKTVEKSSEDCEKESRGQA
ncbi:unnamed protein product, partial [Amoebophrya sp. A120]